MTTESSPPDNHGPSPINGPAFLVFGLLFIILGLSMEGVPLLSFAGLILVGVGVSGIVWQRRYERAVGIEDVLPGKSPEPDSDRDSRPDDGRVPDDGPGSERAPGGGPDPERDGTGDA